MRIPTHLTDSQLIADLARCARDERGATTRLVAHLAEMDARELHLGAGFSSLFAYCCEVLRLSESSTYKRIEVARMARRFPVVLERLADGSLSLASARLLAPHATPENHAELIADAAGLGKRAVEEMLARRFPRPDVSPLIRRIPAPPSLVVPAGAEPVLDAPALGSGPADPLGSGPADSGPAETGLPVPLPPSAPVPFQRHVVPPPLATPLSADRYQIRFTASAATWEKLRVARDLLRHAVPSGDPAEIFDRALKALIDDLARKKHGSARRKQGASKARKVQLKALGRRSNGTPTETNSRYVSKDVRRAVWIRDRGRCAFVGPSGRRCGTRAFIEFHHVRPYAADGPATVDNIELRCRPHNRHEAVLFFGAAKADRRKTAAHVGAVPDTATGLSASGSTGPGASCDGAPSAPSRPDTETPRPDSETRRRNADTSSADAEAPPG